MQHAAAVKKIGFLPSGDPIANYLHEIRDARKLSAKEERVLAFRIRIGDRRAVHALVQANLKRVVAICRRYRNRGLPLLDLIGEGNLGLFRAASRFRGDEDCRFASYADGWIRQTVLAALADGSRSARAAASVAAKLRQLAAVSRKLAGKLGREPSAEELESQTGMRPGTLRAYLRLMAYSLSLQPFERQAYGPGSASGSPAWTETQAAPFLGRRAMENLLKGLGKRERAILRRYFGMRTGVKGNLAQAAGTVKALVRLAFGSPWVSLAWPWPL